MKGNASADTKRSAASPEIPRILLNHKVHYVFRKKENANCPYHESDEFGPRYPIAFFQTDFTNIFHTCLGFQRGLLLPDFPTKTSHAFFTSPKHTTCSAHHIPLDFITVIISGVDKLSGSSSLCSCFRYHVTFFLLDTNLRHLVMKTSSAYVLITSETTVTPSVNGNTIHSSTLSNKSPLVTTTPSNTP